jgi:hypothetical protein
MTRVYLIDIKDHSNFCMDDPTLKEIDKEFSPETLLIRSGTEFCSVIFQLICFSRLGTKDYYYLVNQNTTFAQYDSQLEPSLAANFVLFVTLLVFHFPFLNGYILFTYDTCVIGRTSINRVLFCLFVIGFQIAGVAAAYGIIKWLQGHWSDSITWIVPAFKATDEGRIYEAEIFEEFLAVTALLVGYIHLVYYNFQTPTIRIFHSPTHAFSDLTKGENKLPIPLPFIMQVTLLVAGLLRAFPTSHLSPHISCYLLIMEYTTWSGFGCRIGAGIAAYFVTLAWFWGLYSKRNGLHPTKSRNTIQDTTRLPLLGIIGPPQHPIDETGQPHPQRQTISFNNAYRHVYAT